MELAHTEIKTSTAPNFPTYRSASPGSCMGFFVRRGVSATYSMETVVNTPAIISHISRIGHPAFREE